MAKHIYVEPTDPDHHCDNLGNCMICDGGLAICKVCGGAEGALTSECPERQIKIEEMDRIHKGEIDFRNGEWVQAISPHSPAAYR